MLVKGQGMALGSAIGAAASAHLGGLAVGAGLGAAAGPPAACPVPPSSGTLPVGAPTPQAPRFYF